MSFLQFVASLVLMVLGGSSLANVLIYGTETEYLGWHIARIIIFLPIAVALLYRAIGGLEKYVYKMKADFIKENDFCEGEKITLGHEKTTLSQPKHLLTITIDERTYLADDFDIYRISSYHTGYVFKMVPKKYILVIHDSHTGKWETFSKRKL